MYRPYRSLLILGMLAVFSLSAIVPAFAGSAGRKNTAIGLTAATVYSVLNKNDRAGLVLGLGSAAAWKNYEDARKHESRQRSYRVQGYRGTYRPTYRSYRPHPSYRSYSTRTHYVPATSPVHDLQRQLAQAKAQNAATQHQAKIGQLSVENKALKDQIAQQNLLIAGVQSDVSKSRIHMALVIGLALIGMGAMAVRLPRKHG